MASPLSGDGQATVIDLAGSDPLGAWAASFPATVAALFSGIKWGNAMGFGAEITYSFPKAGATWSPDYSFLDEPDAFVALTADQATAVRLALGDWAAVADLAFQEVGIESATDVGLMRFGSTHVTSGDAVGWAYYPSRYSASGGDAWLSQATLSGYAARDWLPGGSGYSVLLHEIGHALGLKHPFAYSNSAPVTLPASEDTQQYTLMSYTSHPHDLFRTVTTDGSGGYGIDLKHVQSDAPMIYDIMAIQYLYGANTAYNSGDDIYTFNPAVPFFRTIWDGGGTDTISVSNFQNDSVISLVPGTFSKVTILSDPMPPGYSGSPVPEPTYDGTDNLGIAFDCWIENAIGGAGNDMLIGNLAENVLTGGLGNDTLDGGLGIDTASYASATASISLDLGFTSAQNTGGAGSDTLLNIENVIGGQSDDVLIGNSGNNQLDGGTGNDIFLDSAAGDTMVGSNANDTYYVDNVSDVIVETYTGTGNTDLVNSFLAAYTLGSNIEAGRIRLSSSANLTGNELSNTLTGGAGNNLLAGGSGNDTLTGGTGADTFRFDTASNATTNLDTITDFTSDTDKIELENAIFTALTATGALSAGMFWSGAGITTAADADDFLIYNSSTGALYYDPDGSGSTASIQFATLSTNPVLTDVEFVVS